LERKQNRIQASLDKNHVEAMKMTLVNGSKAELKRVIPIPVFEYGL